MEIQPVSSQLTFIHESLGAEDTGKLEGESFFWNLGLVFWAISNRDDFRLYRNGGQGGGGGAGAG